MRLEVYGEHSSSDANAYDIMFFDGIILRNV